ncbi:MAG: hypothetical protein DKT66_22830 [Candidatus Melainabacteria bacterium]|nr:MAG: hypothetical protein DKT66_22830 [Candidatus Melainabacteria bacterium]
MESQLKFVREKVNKMPEDPYDPNPPSNWGKLVMVLAGIAIIVLGVWAFAGTMISKALTGQ